MNLCGIARTLAIDLCHPLAEWSPRGSSPGWSGSSEPGCSRSVSRAVASRFAGPQRPPVHHILTTGATLGAVALL